MSSIVRRKPQIISCDLQRVLPKFEFLAARGASSSNIVLLVTKNPIFMISSLNNKVVLAYELVSSLFQFDKRALQCIVTCPYFLMQDCLAQMSSCWEMKESLTPSLAICFILELLCSCDLRKATDEVKKLGFAPSKVVFGVALIAKAAVPKPNKDAKVDALKSWGGLSKQYLKHS